MSTVAEIPWSFIIIFCLTLGLAPFNPPHIVEKLKMLKEGDLRRPLDVFDLLMHSVPWALLVLKVGVSASELLSGP